MYIIIDRQLNQEFANGVTFDTIDDVIDQLADYHSVDFDDEVYGNDIYRFLDKLPSNKERLQFLLEHGEWDIQEIKSCEKCGGETSSKFVGDESYDYCKDCNWTTH